ncbi:hypothetical protein SK854_06110 [Lentzea sp. BCCO 10_0061]|uniref:Uncharacterized protein n=1 Tax=Lentzea sokolovensis TaxID=3095429 RepID=A0ABU4UQX0_9PSEU|nr:hypothetical protein [Lentzea sp. BCCO 10_0061]MDX8141675.1 hypothetical protein [Lentzea sp. BCCO 10_0061]
MLIARLTARLRCYVPEPVDETGGRLRHLGARREQLIVEQVTVHRACGSWAFAGAGVAVFAGVHGALGERFVNQVAWSTAVRTDGSASPWRQATTPCTPANLAGTPLPIAQPIDVHVVANRFTTVEVPFDSDVRDAPSPPA